MELQKRTFSEDCPEPSSYEVFDNSYVLTEGVIKRNGKVVGYGRIKILAEAIITLDNDQSLISRAKELKMFFNQAIKDAKEAGVEQIHAFVQDEKFAVILEKHFGFEPVKGIPLVLDLRSEEK